MAEMNIPDIYPGDAAVDETSYCILLRIREADDLLWKRELSRRLNDWRSGGLCPLNIDDPVNVQTVSRKVDGLEENGLLESVVVYPDGLQRYVEGFRLTEEGEMVLNVVSDAILEELLVRYVDRCVTSEGLSLAPGMVERLSENATMDIDVETVAELEKELCERIDRSMGDRLAVEG